MLVLVIKSLVFFLKHSHSQIRYTDFLVDSEYGRRLCSIYLFITINHTINVFSCFQKLWHIALVLSPTTSKKPWCFYHYCCKMSGLKISGHGHYSLRLGCFEPTASLSQCFAVEYSASKMKRQTCPQTTCELEQL